MAKPSHFFIAIPLTKELQNYFGEWQRKLQQFTTYKQWPHMEDLHITLKFLGAVEKRKLERLKYELKGIEQQTPVQLTVGKIGTFGNKENPRVLWAGVEKREQLLILHEEVEKIAEKVGFQRETRNYTPHITLAKKSLETCGLNRIKQIQDEYQQKSRLLKVNQIVLYQIFPLAIPKYKIVETYYLTGGEVNGATN